MAARRGSRRSAVGKRVLLEVSAMFDDVALDRFIARSTVALAGELAFDDCVELVAGKDKLSVLAPCPSRVELCQPPTGSDPS